MINNKNILKQKLHHLIGLYFNNNLRDKKFIPGKTLIRYAGTVYDEEDLNAMLDAMLGGWFGLNKQGEILEEKLTEYLGAKKTFLTNSGSSAGLLAVSALMSNEFTEKILPGDEVITPACTFPTLVSSLIHKGLKPVFVDVDKETLNPNPNDIEKAVTKKTKLIYLVHTLGNPNDMDRIMKIANNNKIMVLEDNCDALGSTYKNKKTGSFGIMAIESFYPAHHMTTAGEGGAVLLNDLRLQRIISSLREWGRACWCGASDKGKNGACNARFKFKIDGVFYDHKYIFSQIGYNLKPIEIQAAMGITQLKKLPQFIKTRKKNFESYYNFFKDYQKYFILPKITPNSDPSWFAFPLTIKENAPFDRFKITQFLEQKNIQTRPLFAGNILKQPAFKKINCRIVGELTNSDRIFFNSFFIGIYPGLTEKHIEYVMLTFKKFFKKFK